VAALDERMKRVDETLTRVRAIVADANVLAASVGKTGGSLGEMHANKIVKAMQMAKQGGNPDAAQLVAAECVVEAETKDHMNWELIGQCVEKLSGAQKKALKDAHDEVEEEEDEHLYHTQGWARELWIQSLGMKAVLPPPEEEKDVKTAIGAARAKQSRKEML